MTVKVDAIIDRFDNMKTARTPWETRWRDLAEYILPRRTLSDERSDGEDLRESVYDSTGEKSNNRLAAALQAMLINDDTKWFSLRGRLSDGTYIDDADEEAARFFDTLRDTVLDYINASNFSQSADELFLDMGSLATGVILALDGGDDDTPLIFKTLPIGECYLAENNKGIVDILYRKYKQELRQVVQEFGVESLSPQALEKYKKNAMEKIEILHVIEPRDDYPKNPATAADFPFTDIYIELDSKHVLREGGFREFPAACPRWRKASGEVYGRGPGHECIKELKMLSEMAYSNIQAAHRMVEPPMDTIEESYISKLDLSPNAINERQKNSEPAQPIHTVASLPASLQLFEMYRRDVRESFFWEQLTLIDNDRMTATEVIQRTEENMRILGPTGGRFYTELLEVILRRILSILGDRGLLPPIPDSMAMGGKVIVVYESPLARAQRSIELQSLERGFATVAPLMQVKPDIVDNIDFDGAVREILALTGFKKKFILQQPKVDAIRKARAEMQAREQMAEQLTNATRAAKEASETDPDAGLLGKVFQAR